MKCQVTVPPASKHHFLQLHGQVPNNKLNCHQYLFVKVL
eukprot:07764.XXX_285152_285268_1 [CDS] Oithona nana genome sequencing.